MRRPDRAWTTFKRRDLRLASLALLGALVALNWVPTGYFAVRPGPVRSLAGLITVADRPAPKTSFYMVAVVAEKTNVYSLLRALVDPSEEVWSAQEVYAGKSEAQYSEEQKALMAESQRTAAHLAFRESGFALGPDDPLPLGVSVQSGEVLGPSAGLAFALEMVSTLQGVDLAAGRKIAATGVLEPDGEVAPVGGIAQKVASCRSEGIEVFLVPAANEAEAREDSGNVKVVGVRTLGEALLWLREIGHP